MCCNIEIWLHAKNATTLCPRPAIAFCSGCRIELCSAHIVECEECHQFFCRECIPEHARAAQRIRPTRAQLRKLIRKFGEA
jgi:predicted sulfurtransferase